MENNKPASNNSDIDFNSVLDEITKIDVPVDQPDDLNLDLEKAVPSNKSAVDSTFDTSVLEAGKSVTGVITDGVDIADNSAQMSGSILKEADYSADVQDDKFDSDITLDDGFVQVKDAVDNGINDDVDSIFDSVTDTNNVEETIVNADADFSENSLQQDVFNNDSQGDFNQSNFNGDELNNNFNQDVGSSDLNGSDFNAPDFNTPSLNTELNNNLQDDFNSKLDEDWGKTADINDLGSSDIGSSDIGTISSMTDSDNDEDGFAALATPPPVKKQLDNTKLLKVLALVIALAIICLLAFLFLGGSDSASETQAKTPVETAPKTSAENKPAKVEEAKVEEAKAKETATHTEEKPAIGASKSSMPAVVEAKVPEDKKSAKGEKAPADKTAKQTADKQTKVAEKTDKKVAEPAKPVAKKSTVGATQINTPDPKAILNAEIPKDEALVKEEIDKLSDEDQRLLEQQKLLDKRIDMMDELTAKKQEQIELLEKQIAQLEAEQKKSN